MEHLLVYANCLRSFHRDQHIVDAHSANFQIDVTLFLLSHNILICGRDQHIVDAHSDNFRIDVTLFLLSHKILLEWTTSLDTSGR